MSRRSLSLFAPLLLVLSGWGSAQAGVLPSCTATFGAPGAVSCVDVSIAGLSVQGSGALPLGPGYGPNANSVDNSYGDVLTDLTLSQTGAGGGYVALTGIVGSTAYLSGALAMPLNLLLADVDPVYDFTDGVSSISANFTLGLSFTGTVDLASPDLLSSATLSTVAPTAIKIPLNIDINANGELDALFIDNINLTSLDGLLVDAVIPAAGYPSATLTLGSATGTFDGRVQDALTDPPFTLEVTGSAVGASVPAPASLWLLAMGGLLATLTARRLSRRQ